MLVAMILLLEVVIVSCVVVKPLALGLHYPVQFVRIGYPWFPSEAVCLGSMAPFVLVCCHLLQVAVQPWGEQEVG